jgi:hypothetical protein
MIKAAIKDLRTPRPEVGDRVEFQIGEETLTDIVTYVMGHVIEGKIWDLTYIKNLSIIKPTK